MMSVLHKLEAKPEQSEDQQSVAPTLRHQQQGARQSGLEQPKPFDAPWQAQAFAMAVKAHEAGCFEWPEFSQELGAQLARKAPATSPASNASYYEAWLRTLENILHKTNHIHESQLEKRQQAWRRAAESTPHGEPIELAADARQIEDDAR